MKTTVVGYDFKRERFEELHAKALKIPSAKFAFVGTPEVMSFKKQFMEGEVKVRGLFKKDAYGCEAPLSEKRKLRDPFAVPPWIKRTQNTPPSSRCLLTAARPIDHEHRSSLLFGKTKGTEQTDDTSTDDHKIKSTHIKTPQKHSIL